MGIKRGFSLIEVSVAVLLLGVITAGTLTIFSQGLFRLRNSLARTIACSLAREGLEENFYWGSGGYAQTAVADFPGYSREVVVSPLNARLAQINVTVWWDNGSRRETFQTFKADY